MRSPRSSPLPPARLPTTTSRSLATSGCGRDSGSRRTRLTLGNSRPECLRKRISLASARGKSRRAAICPTSGLCQPQGRAGRRTRYRPIRVQASMWRPLSCAAGALGPRKSGESPPRHRPRKTQSVRPAVVRRSCRESSSHDRSRSGAGTSVPREQAAVRRLECCACR